MRQTPYHLLNFESDASVVSRLSVRFAMACILIAGWQSILAAAERRHPNVVLIIADDMNRLLPCYGNNLVHAPNVDRLAVRSMRFDRAYCQYPVCSPSRVSFLSGRRPEQTGMYGNDGDSRTPTLKDAVFLPQHFKANGYFTARFGKVFHIGRDLPECWDVSEEGSPTTKPVYQPQEVEKLGLGEFVIKQHRLKGGGGEGASYTILSGGKADLIDVRNGQRAAEVIIERAKTSQPFFLACGFRRPHLPHLATSEFFDRYQISGMPLPEAGGPQVPGIKESVSDNDSREALRGYLACVTFMDEQLGKVLDALDSTNLWEDTIVVFLGDHGYMLGSRGGWWGKNLVYDESAGTSLLIAAPGKVHGVGCSRVVEFLDLYPTLSELCGLPVPVGTEGRSIVALLNDPNAMWDHAAFTILATKGTPSGLAVSTERWRYIEHADGLIELFDVKADPREWNNLAGEVVHKMDLVAMKQVADAYKARFVTKGLKELP